MKIQNQFQIQTMQAELEVQTMQVDVLVRPFVMKSCFCLSLKRGCLIIGYVNLILHIILAVMTPFLWSTLVNRVLRNNAAYSDLTREELDNALNEILTVIVVVIILKLFSDIFLLVGIYKRKLNLLKAFMIIISCLSILSLMALIATVICGPICIDVKTISVYICLNIWFIFKIVLVHSHHSEIKDELQRAKIINDDSSPIYTCDI